jgi:hypothetical protein
MPVQTTRTDDPWGHPQQVFNKFARTDRELSNRLQSLSLHQARDTKLAEAIEAGRVYGLQKQFYDMKLKRSLNAEHPEAEAMW